ncbi:cell division protein ZapA [Hydrogenophaga sp.]|uniref:cell division protein ZapA n=1 Tax=Hydrogenophaga sp. TaxID=1904254 RepID=UPI00286E4721|nr:cell division protein ZapA [Hydrogenophaga sp.]
MNKPANKQIEVQIMGQSYLLACPVGGEQSLLDAVERVDTAMCRIRDAGKVKARDRIAVLASLNLAFELSQKESQSLQASAQASIDTTPTASLAGDTLDPAAQGRVNDLIRRLDQSLGSDGQLL